MQYLDQISKNDRMLCFQGKPFNITVIHIYALTSNAEVEVEPSALAGRFFTTSATREAQTEAT